MYKKLGILSLALSLCTTAFATPPAGAPDFSKKTDKQDPLVRQRSHAESMKEFEVQEDYSLELVAGDDMLSEPTLCVWDGNGRMYVAQFETYMQDVDGTGKYDKISRVLRLEDTNNDGIIDKRTVFADKLNLPRLVLPLKDSVLIGETNTLDIYEYWDTNNDGKADKKKIWYEGGKRGGNLEHQPSGLLWSIDNNIHTTYNKYSFRYTDGTVKKVPNMGNRGQWGLTQDNLGKVIYCDAGAGVGPVHTLFPNVYTKWDPKWVRDKDFRSMYGIDKVYDAQGGFGAMHPNGSLKRFTDTCGQAVFRGDRLPKEMVGDLFFSSPVGRLTRRATFKKDSEGRRIMTNVYGNKKKEFIASTDANFRPVNAATGPDGTLYLVDMHRGIIQEGQWVPKGSFVRKSIEYYGLDKNIKHGRIYRVRHPDFKPGPKPNMLNETPAQLVKHLSHPNGWWRDEAQKLIILHGDKSVIPALQKIVISGKSALGRLHALWTLEGFNALKLSHLQKLYKDKDVNIRTAAIRMTEPFFQKDISVLKGLAGLVKDPSYDVHIQLLLSMSTAVTPESRQVAEAVLAANPANTYLKEIDSELNKAYFEEKARQEALASFAKEERELMDLGSKHYSGLCASCHGANGQGVPAGNQLLAPSFVNNPRVLGDKSLLAHIALNGFTGPIAGKTYTGGVMLALKSNDDKYIAAALTYIRNSWGNKAVMVTPQDIAKVRRKTSSVTGPYTEKTIRKVMLNSGDDIKLWKLSATKGQKYLPNLQDDDLKNTYATKSQMKKGFYIQADFPHERKISRVILQAKGNDFPKALKVEISTDGKTWQTVAAKVKGKRTTVVSFPTTIATKLRVTCLEDKKSWWQLYDFKIPTPQK